MPCSTKLLRGSLRNTFGTRQHAVGESRFLDQEFFSRQFSSLSRPVEVESTYRGAKTRRLYAVGGCMVFMWLSTHGFLLYRRQQEHRHLTKKIPPISWEEFVEDYLMRGLVKSVIYQPQYETGNVFLHSTTEKSLRKSFLDKEYFATGKSPHTPDVRFSFHGDGTAVKKALLDLQKASNGSPIPLKAVEFKIDDFPNYWEMAFIAISTVLTLGVITLAK
ncbi:hypothetical protein KIN20_000947 [Parelaphostrongylus tenuis]|uniref:Uncharacterized protein n=1 Tax=Parelaphostrongylus tenuis TaxID=148309 RepID=A0AAD5LW86_PARTN|nr:hypothetical protein KIN20_000947 [Parelaphostrongylus tenuis]